MKCKQCGNEIPKEKLVHNDRTVLYCSRECMDIDRGRKNVTCSVCGTTFKPNRVGQKYCSLVCANQVPRVRRVEWKKRLPDFKYNDQNDSMYGFGDGVAGIYKITNNINGKVYIGKSKNIGKRISQHRQKAKGGDMPIYRAFRKYGVGNFTFEIIHKANDVLSFELCSLEREYIKKHKSNHPKYGYNATDGGEGGELNELTQAKLDAIVKSEAWRTRTSEMMKKWWAENREKMMEIQKAKSKRQRKKRISKQVAARKPEKKDTKKVCCVEKQCTFDSMTEAAKACGTRQASVWSVCNGKCERANGFHFYWMDGEPVVFNRKPRVLREQMTKEQRMAFIERSIARGVAKKIICIDTGTVYRSCGEAAIILGVDVKKLRKHVHDPRNRTSVGGLRFRFIEAV